MNTITRAFILLATILLMNTTTCIYAQPPIDDDNVEDNPVPFDNAGSVSMLVAAAVCYGLKKAYDNKKHPATVR